MRYVLSLDQGTTSSRALIFDENAQIVAVAQEEFTQYYPYPGWVEHDAKEIWHTTYRCIQRVLQQAHLAMKDIVSVGVTNQRETTVVWDRRSGEPIGKAIVWQDRRTTRLCEELMGRGQQDMIRGKTGLCLDPYFSATKLMWRFLQDPQLRQKARAGRLAFGTIDSWLIWNLTAGKAHITDVSNASRTLLCDLKSGQWDDELLDFFQIPKKILPKIVSSMGVVAYTRPSIFGCAIPIAGIAGDQQAAMFGQVALEKGSAKNTYGTGAFLLLNIGQTPRLSAHRLLTTALWREQEQQAIQYALEGSVFMAGAVVQWLRDGLQFFQSAAEVEDLARQVPDNGGVYLVPAFVGLGAPHWDSEARGTIVGLTRGSTRAHIARAAIEGIAFQCAEVLSAMQLDAATELTELRVDGGASRNDLLLQIQADISGVPVIRPKNTETTSLGVAYMAGLACGVWRSKEVIQEHWQVDRVFEPTMSEDQRFSLMNQWTRAVGRARKWNM